MERKLENFDIWFVHFVRRISIPLARVALFIVFFWFGILKIIGTSPANPLVKDLMETTLPFMTFEQFIIGFAIYEMIIGIAFVLPRCERLAIALLLPHMMMTFLPLIFLAPVTWQGFMTPTMEGQYIIKNLVIIALAFGIAAHLSPIHLLQKKKRSR
ncbi:MAG: hypothetical protein HZA80_02215 [Candidatus Taylorbacteria bacterium]|nr:hypothetical protein [Candidatus Taylorbacteria bacterium]